MGLAVSPSTIVLRRFIAGANAQYRAAGLSAHQLRVDDDGTVHAARFDSSRTPRSMAGRDSMSVRDARRGASMQVTSRRSTGGGGFEVAWRPVTGAKRYGVYQDGVLLGHVPHPRFAGTVTSGMAGSLRFDAVLPSGVRSARSSPVRVVGLRGGAVDFPTAGAAAAR